MLQHSGINVHNDEMHIHPESFCGSCRTKAKRYFDAKQPKSSLHAYQWTDVDPICATLPRVAAERCPYMDDMAQAVANKYGRALMLYSKCHGQFNSSNTSPLKCLFLSVSLDIHVYT